MTQASNGDESRPSRLARRAVWCMVLLAGCGTPSIAAPATQPHMVVATIHALPPVATAAPTMRPTTQPPSATPDRSFTTFSAPTATPQPAPPELTPTPNHALTLDERKRIFDEVWQIVNERYLYANFNGIDWHTLHTSFAPRIAAARSNDAFYALLEAMVNELNDHHSRFGPPAVVINEDAVVSGHEPTVGVGMLIIPSNDGAFVQNVFPDSPAAQAGLRPRDRIIAVDGRPYQPTDANFQGQDGSMVRLTVMRPGEKPWDVNLPRREVDAHITPYYQRFQGDIGYLWISTLWVSDTDEQVSGALTELVAAGPLNGLVLDLRGNPGGWGHVLSGILSHFVRGQVGMFFDRNNQMRPLVVQAPAGPDLRALPLVVLIDQDTASYAEVLGAVLQQEDHATVIGVPSAGNTETIYAHTFFDGSRLWLSQEGFRLQNGKNLEGHGVEPDRTIDVDWKRYSEADDPQLLDALHVLGAPTP